MWNEAEELPVITKWFGDLYIPFNTSKLYVQDRDETNTSFKCSRTGVWKDNQRQSEVFDRLTDSS